MSYSSKKIPVPNTGKNHGFRNYFKTYFRIVKTTNEIRQFFACENKELIRGKRKPRNLHTTWDDVSRHQEKSWKRQTKNERQHGYNQWEIRKFLHIYDEALLENEEI